MKGSLYTLLFAAAVGVACATLLTAVGQLTQPARERNQRADEKRCILAAMDPTYPADVDAAGVLADFEAMIPDGAESRGHLTVYTYRRDGTIAARAVKFAGDGVWGPIEGYLVLEPDWITIRAMAITRQNETPGLGAEIATDRFRSQFAGKRIVADDGTVGLRIRMTGPTAAAHEVAGVTGATKTSQSLEQMLNDVATEIRKEADHD